MFPSMGRIVTYVQPASEQPVNGKREHPAMITHVWNDSGVNLQVFFDAGTVAPRTSVLRDDIGGANGYWKWPDRV